MDPFRPGLECYKGGLSLGVWGSKIKEYMKMGMGMGPRQSLRQEQKLTQTQILEQRISARLLIELRQDVGKFEKQILKKVEFVGIDPEEPVDGKFKGLICKEFIPGEVLGNVTADIELSKETHGEAAMKKLAYAVGKMFANCLNEFGGVPRDSNSLNIIIVNSNLENPVTRFCDVEEVRRDEAGIKLELRLMVAEFEEFGNEVTRGIKDNLSEELKDVYP